MNLADQQLPQFQWRESRQGVWERDLDECEIFYRRSAKGGDGCYPVTGCASFGVASESVEDEDRLEAALRAAWAALRHRHPTLDSRVELDEASGHWKRVCSPLKDEGAENNWPGLTFKVIDVDGDALQWFNAKAPSFKAPTVFFVRSKRGDVKRRHTIFLRCPHDITDAVGILQLVNQLFEYAALGCSGGAGNALPGDAKEHTSLYGPGKAQRIPLSVPRDLAEQILRGCKAIAPGVSVTHVFLAALAVALRELQPQKEAPYPVRYVNHSMIKLRPYCLPPYHSTEHAAAAYHTVSAQALGIDLVVPSSKSSAGDAGNRGKSDELACIAIQVRDYYKAVRPVPCGDTIHEQIALAPLMFKALTPPPSSDGDDAAASAQPPFCAVALSSIGNVSSIVTAKHGPFELTNVWAASEPMGSGVALFLGSWEGQLELSGVFDTRYHSREYVDGFLQRILRCVCTGLGVIGYSVEDARKDKKRKRVEESGI